MQRKDIQRDLSALSFDFFYWFSRFEFALQENGYLKSTASGAPAEPGWQDFVERWQKRFSPSASTKALVSAAPERQVVGTNGGLAWRPVGLSDCISELERVVRLLKTVRNNRFHGGKHGGAGWDSPQRTRELVTTCKDVLDELAVLAAIDSDYKQQY